MSPLDRLRSSEGLFDATMVRLIDDPTASVTVAMVGLAIAAGIGAVHALGPGHGKALIGAYLVGSRGRVRDTVALGALVAAMHTGSVLALAFVLRATQRATGSERLESALMLVAAAGVVTVGVWMLVDRVRTSSRRARSSTVQQSATMAMMAADQPVHRHGHGGGDAHDHQHALPEGVAPLSRAGMVALAGAGGLLPSPIAFLVLMTAIATGRTGYGIALVLAFSIGLAATLTAVGLAFLWGRNTLDRHTHHAHVAWLVGRLPIASALAVLTGGLVLTWRAATAF